MEIIRYSELIEIPWKNRGGVTRDIAKATCGGEFVWRVSRADVSQEGPFSDFAGLVRVLTVVSDSGMTLEHASGVLEAKPWVPVQFEGGLKVSSKLDAGPLTDLNLMFDPQYCAGDARTLQGPVTKTIVPSAQNPIVLHCLSGAPLLGATALHAGDTAFITNRGCDVNLNKEDAVLKISLKYLCDAGLIALVTA